MPIQTIFTSGVDGDGGLEIVSFFTIVIAIVLGWILVSIFQRLLENLWFQTLHMNPRSTLHSLIIAVVAIFLFVLGIWFIDELQVVPVAAPSAQLREAGGGLFAGAEADDQESNAVVQQLGNGTRNGHPIVLLNAGY